MNLRIGYFAHWFQPAYKLADFLQEQGIPAEKIDYSRKNYLEKYDVVLIEQNGFNDYVENDELYIRDWIRRGGILLFMHQDYCRWAPYFLPEEVGYTQLIHRPYDIHMIFGKGIIQPTLWEDSNHVLHCLMRSKCGRLYTSSSFNNGRSWETARKTDIPNNNSGVDCVKTEDGRVWLVSNPTDTDERSPLTLSVSDDNGLTFKEAAVLEDKPGGEFSYPAIIADGDRLYITYTYQREKIAFAEVSLN